MKAADLAAYKALCKEATPGPWRFDGTALVGRSNGGRDIAILRVAEPDLWTRGTREDVAFIAAAREALPQLIAEVERLRALVGRAA